MIGAKDVTEKLVDGLPSGRILTVLKRDRRNYKPDGERFSTPWCRILKFIHCCAIKGCYSMPCFRRTQGKGENSQVLRRFRKQAPPLSTKWFVDENTNVFLGTVILSVPFVVFFSDFICYVKSNIMEGA